MKFSYQFFKAMYDTDRCFKDFGQVYLFFGTFFEQFRSVY